MSLIRALLNETTPLPENATSPRGRKPQLSHRSENTIIIQHNLGLCNRALKDIDGPSDDEHGQRSTSQPPPPPLSRNPSFRSLFSHPNISTVSKAIITSVRVCYAVRSGPSPRLPARASHLFPYFKSDTLTPIHSGLLPRLYRRTESCCRLPRQYHPRSLPNKHAHAMQNEPDVRTTLHHPSQPTRYARDAAIARTPQ